MEKKNFLGLEGLKYFWTKIEAKVIKIIEEQIAEIIAEAPENLNTLKEIADWISTHEDSASAMNTAILANKTAINGKADKSHTHTKSQITDFPTSLPANGGTADSATKATQDGSGNIITSTYVKKSGDTLTGPIVMKANQYTLDTAQLDMKNSDIKGANAIWFDDHAEVGEGLKFPRSSGSNYDFMRLDDGKIKVAQNVTGNASTATESIVAYTSDIPTSLPANGGTADNAKRLKPFAYWDYPYVYDATNGVRLYVFKIQMVNWFNSILIQIYDDINYARSRRYILGLWHQNNYNYNVSVTDLGGAKYDGLRVWLGNDGNVYLQADIYWNSRISFSYLEDITNITVEKIGLSKEGSNKDIDGNVLFTPLTDPIIDCGAIKGSADLSSASKVEQYLKADVFTGKFQGDVTGNLTGTADKAVSVVDYGDASKTIKIGYTGAGATVNNLSHIAGYLTGGTQIKDVSKDVLKSWIGLSDYLPLSGGTVTGATQFDNYVKLNAWDGYGTGTANFWYDGNNKYVEIQNANTLKLAGVNVSKEGHTHTKSQITDFPTSLPANGGTATTATNLKVSNHDTNNTTYYPIWANGKGDGTTARGIYTSTDLNYIPATGNFKSKQFTVGGGVSLQWNSTTKSLDFTFA